MLQRARRKDFLLFFSNTPHTGLQDRNFCPQLRTAHARPQFVACSRFGESQLLEELADMRDILANAADPLPAQLFSVGASDVKASEDECRILRISMEHLNDSEFRYFLSRHLPLVITGLNRKLQLAWSPAQLTQDFGKDKCTVEDCEGREPAFTANLEYFLKQFTDKAPRTILKVKVSIHYVFTNAPELQFRRV